MRLWQITLRDNKWQELYRASDKMGGGGTSGCYLPTQVVHYLGESVSSRPRENDAVYIYTRRAISTVRLTSTTSSFSLAPFFSLFFTIFFFFLYRQEGRKKVNLIFFFFQVFGRESGNWLLQTIPLLLWGQVLRLYIYVTHICSYTYASWYRVPYTL